MTRKSAPRSAVAKRLLERYIPPEGVPISLELASLGARIGAVFLDLVITWTCLGLIMGLVLWLHLLSNSGLLALLVILAFFVGIPYFVLSELIWHGRTLGKRIVGIRVVSADGRTLAPYQIVARNLLKQAEFFAPISALFGLKGAEWPVIIIVVAWTVVVAVYPMINKRKQRLGDVVAGTLVIVKPKAVLLQDLAVQAPQAKFIFDQTQLDVYGRYELQTLEAILRDYRAMQSQRTELVTVAQTIAKRINFTDPGITADPQRFLTDFYRAQREKLESRQLFGDRREDKFYGTQAGK